MWAGTRPAGAKPVPAQGRGHVDFGSPSLGLLPPQKGLKLTLGLSGAGDVPSPVLQAAALPEQSRQAAVGRGWPWAQLVEARAGGSGTTRATSSSSQTEDPNRQGRGRRGELRRHQLSPSGVLAAELGSRCVPTIQHHRPFHRWRTRGLGSSAAWAGGWDGMQSQTLGLQRPALPCHWPHPPGPQDLGPQNPEGSGDHSRLGDLAGRGRRERRGRLVHRDGQESRRGKGWKWGGGWACAPVGCAHL